ncbi:putative glycolipid-binding domain-containing protein [Paenibacillus sp. JCM 10914]|uniref:putative glycolipid-binding domain-containing protein n=1 Tax=Paenibacillus sp. JCM 10914 TaxID=1236974 RepID=UPI00351C1574
MYLRRNRCRQPGSPSFHCAYEIAITDQWQTRELKIALSGADGEHYLCLRRDEENRWWEGGTDRELGALAGLTDIDLGISPSTNTLAIRRLRLQPGDSAAITAAWVRFPSLEISPLPQRYTRTGENTYRYESNDGAFQADLEIDEHALVTQYADIWSRI